MKLPAYVRKRGVWVGGSRKTTILNSKLTRTLKQEVCTRWNSERILINSYLDVRNEVKTLLLEAGKLDKITSVNDDILQELANFLKPFKHCSDVWSGNTYPTINLVAPHYSMLEKHIKITDKDSAEMKLLKGHCFSEYCVTEDFHYAALMLDPR